MKKIRNKELITILVLIAAIVIGLFGFQQTLRFILRTDSPLAAVSSKSMVPTIRVGDIIVVQGVLNMSEINTASAPEGDIIVFREPGDPNDFIVHRAIEKVRRGDNLFFKTKGDNNPYPDSWLISEHTIIGRVVGRIPLFGFLSLFLQTIGGILFIAIVLVVMFITSILPQKKERKADDKRLIAAIWILFLITFLPYVASLLTKNETLLYSIELVALTLWYLSSLITPLIMRDLSASIFFWLYHLVLVALPVGCDIVYRITGIMPIMWWFDTKHLMPIIWFLQNNMTDYYYLYTSNLILILVLGGVLFSTMFIIKTRVHKSD